MCSFSPEEAESVLFPRTRSNTLRWYFYLMLFRLWELCPSEGTSPGGNSFSTCWWGWKQPPPLCAGIIYNAEQGSGAGGVNNAGWGPKTGSPLVCWKKKTLRPLHVLCLSSLRRPSFTMSHSPEQGRCAFQTRLYVVSKILTNKKAFLGENCRLAVAGFSHQRVPPVFFLSASLSVLLDHLAAAAFEWPPMRAFTTTAGFEPFHKVGPTDSRPPQNLRGLPDVGFRVPRHHLPGSGQAFLWLGESDEWIRSNSWMRRSESSSCSHLNVHFLNCREVWLTGTLVFSLQVWKIVVFCVLFFGRQSTRSSFDWNTAETLSFFKLKMLDRCLHTLNRLCFVAVDQLDELEPFSLSLSAFLWLLGRLVTFHLILLFVLLLFPGLVPKLGL